MSKSNSVNNWKAQDQAGSTYIGCVELENGQYFEIVKNDTHLIFGNTCNTGLLESGNFLLDDGFSVDENLQELISDLECYYQDGAGYQSDNFACNERM